jgi:Domain of unknown function DUF11
VVNDGPSEASGAVLTDVLPPEVTLLWAGPSQGTCRDGDGGTVVCDLGDIPAGGAAWVEIQVQPDVAGLVVDTASVTSTVHDPHPADNQASVTVLVEAPGPEADLELDFRSETSEVEVGASFPVELRVTNYGPEDAVSVVVAGTVPAGTDLLRASPSQGSCSVSTPLVCELGGLAVGERASILIFFQPRNQGEAVYEWRATSQVRDPDLSNNSGSLTVIVTGPSPEP